MTKRKDDKQPTQKAVGYIRVSTPGQAKQGESLKTQREAIENHCRKEGLELVHVYRDEGISGGTVKDRPGLLDLLSSINGIDYIIVHRLSRLGRNARELLNNVHIINEAGVEIYFIKENIDQSSPYGKMMLTMMAAFAEMEREITGEACRENKINRCKSGIPAVGKPPFGRKFNRVTGEWYYDPPEIRDVVQDIADRYLAGESLKKIAKTIPKKYSLSYTYITKLFHNSAGRKWTVHFKSENEPVVYDIPPLLDDETIKRVQERLAFNTKFNRHDVKNNKYLLSGFIYCEGCKKALVGQSQSWKGAKYQYYWHSNRDGCETINSINATAIEEAVFKAIFENTLDQEGFNQAIRDNFSDEDKAVELKEQVKKLRAELDKQYKRQDEIAKHLVEGTMSIGMIQKADKECSGEIEQLKTELSTLQNRLDKMPVYVDIRNQAERIRVELKGYFGSMERLEEMTFEEKRRLLHAIFAGHDHEGTKYGVYVEKTGTKKYNYLIYASLFHGVRTLFGDDPDYFEDDEDPPNNNGKKPKSPSNKGNNAYKTKIQSQNSGDQTKSTKEAKL